MGQDNKFSVVTFPSKIKPKRKCSILPFKNQQEDPKSLCVVYFTTKIVIVANGVNRLIIKENIGIKNVENNF